MKTYDFYVVASGLDPEATDLEDRLIEAGCDDATIAFQKGLILAAFDREASDFEEALLSAVCDVQDAGAIVHHVEPDDLVSLADIARRSALTRAAISHYFAGARGEAFPNPVAKISTDNPLWRWLEVAAWLHARDQVPLEALQQAQAIARMNEILDRGDQITRKARPGARSM